MALLGSRGGGSWAQAHVTAAAKSASAPPPRRPEIHGLRRAVTAQNLCSRFVPSQAATQAFRTVHPLYALYRRLRSNLPEQRRLPGEKFGMSIARTARSSPSNFGVLRSIALSSAMSDSRWTCR
jgi:hypothetical protein